MRMMALVLAAGLLWPASTFAQDNGARRGYVDGNKLYQMALLRFRSRFAQAM